MYEIGDALLFTLSAWRRCTWAQYRRAFDDLHARSLAAGRTLTGEQDPAIRGHAARLMESLAHLDVVFDAGGDGIFITPSVLSQLPGTGLPRAVLCGSRSPETLGALQRAASLAGRSVKVLAERQAAFSVLAPARVEIQARSESLLAQLAADVGVAYEQVPPAWSLSSLMGSVEELLDSLTWSERPDLTWPRTDFDPAQLRFAGRRDSGALILARYQDPVRGQPRFWLWRGEESAEIDDPAWGRYAVLAADGREVLQYDAMSGELVVPAGARLPRLISRAVTLCSGYAPGETLRERPGEGPPRRCHAYRRVPRDVYDVLAGKMGQQRLMGLSNR